MRLLTVLFLALVCAGVAHAADLRVATLMPVEDLSLPFWCNWSYDWDERCYWDDSDRLSVGGVDDKVWRAALRFAVPTGVQVVTAELSLWGMGPGFEVEAHPINTAPWRSEREVEIGPAVAFAEVEPGWTTWDLTDLVAEWASGALPNDGVLLKLVDEQEAYDSGGPSFASATYPDATRRPRLTVWYSPP